MNKIEKESLNTIEANVKELTKIFPEVEEEGKINFDKLKMLLGEYIDNNEEKYELTWNGKQNALKISQTTSTGTLLPCKEKSVNWDNTENVYIEGDNLEVLKILQKSYNRRVDIIYIDPPYNTGNEFVYKDDFKDNIKNYKEQTNQEHKANAETSGRFHTEWLNMMYPRLRLAKNLLSDTGIIFISIDDNELENLKKICNEIFTERNYIGMFSVENNPKGRKNSKFISVSNEYCLVYAKNKENDKCYFIENIPKSQSDMELDENGDYIQSGGRRVLVGEQDFNSVAEYSSDKHYSVYYNEACNDIKILKEKNIDEKNDELIAKGYKRYISYNKDKFIENTYTDKQFMKLFEENNLIFKDSKIYEKNASTTIRIKSMLTNRKYDAIINGKVEKNYEIDLKTTSAKTKLKELFELPDAPFSTPKNENFISLLISLIEKKDLICLDFFAGSSTTAHAIMNLNAKDNGKRKFILVQLPENLEENLKKAKQTEKKNIQAAIDYLTNRKMPLYVTEIGEERIRRAGNKIKQEKGEQADKLDIGFKVFKLDESNIKQWNSDELNKENANQYFQMHINPIVEGRTTDDLLYEIILKEGLLLSTSIEEIEIEGKKAYSVNNDSKVIFIEDEITLDIVRKIGEMKPDSVVFKDSGFKDENIKINALQELKKYGIAEENVKSI